MCVSAIDDYYKVKIKNSKVKKLANELSNPFFNFYLKKKPDRNPARFIQYPI
jgi:hypothetical protein